MKKPSERIAELRKEIEWPGNGNIKFAVENIQAIIDYLDELYAQGLLIPEEED